MAKVIDFQTWKDDKEVMKPFKNLKEMNQLASTTSAIWYKIQDEKAFNRKHGK